MWVVSAHAADNWATLVAVSRPVLVPVMGAEECVRECVSMGVNVMTERV